MIAYFRVMVNMIWVRWTDFGIVRYWLGHTVQFLYSII